MAGSDASEGQAVWQPGGAEEDSRLREGNRHLHLAYDDEEEVVEPGTIEQVHLLPWNLRSSTLLFFFPDRLVGLAIKASASRAADPVFDYRLRCRGIFRVESCPRLKSGTPVATLPGAWRYRISAGNGLAPVSVYCDWVR